MSPSSSWYRRDRAIARMIGGTAAAVAAGVAMLLLGPGCSLADPLPPQIHTVAGGGTCSLSQTFSGGTCDAVAATSTSIGSTRSVSPLPTGGYLYVDETDDLVREVQPNGQVITVAGTMTPDLQNQYVPDTTDVDGIPATHSGLDDPVAVAVLPNGGFLITEFGGSRVRLVSPGLPGHATITTIAGIPPSSSSSAPTPGSTCVATPPSGSPCLGTQEELNHPSDAEPTASGGVLIADTYNNRILLLASATTGATVEQIAGGGSCADDSTTSSCDGMQASRVALDLPTAVSEFPYDPGSYLFAEYGADAVRRISSETPSGTFTTVAGTQGSPGYTGDGGPATAAQISAPEGVTATPNGGFVIADTGNQVIRQVSPSGTIATIAGTPGQPDYAGDGGDATAASLNTPTEAAPTLDGGILIADEGNGAIREITEPSVSYFAITPSAPNGKDGWYVTAPDLTVGATQLATVQCELNPPEAPPAYGAILTVCPYSPTDAALPDGTDTIWAASQNGFGDQENPISATYKVDTTPPTIKCASPLQAFAYGERTKLTATLTDSLSGPSSKALAVHVSTKVVGAGRARVTGADNAGKSQTVTCHYDVSARTFDPLPSVVRAGATRRFVDVRSLTVTNVPAWAKVYVVCGGRGCPFTSGRYFPTVRSSAAKRGARVAALGHLFTHANLARGAWISIAVVAPGTVGRFLNLRLGKHEQARLNTACLPVGAMAPDGRACKVKPAK